jgi:hypothetical protein
VSVIIERKGDAILSPFIYTTILQIWSFDASCFLDVDSMYGLNLLFYFSRIIDPHF